MRSIPLVCSYLITLSLLILFTTIAKATEESSIYPYFDGGFEDGGDTLSSIRRIGPFGGTYKIKAGGGLRFSLGAMIDMSHQNFNGDMLVTLGFIGDDDSGSNGTAEFDVSTINLVYRFHMPETPHQFGVGLTYHLNPLFEFDESRSCATGNSCISTSLTPGEIEFDDALGSSLRYEYIMSLAGKRSGISLGARYTMINYKSSEFDADASGLGLFIALHKAL